MPIEHANETNTNQGIRIALGKLISIENEENWWKPELFERNTRAKIPQELEIISGPPTEESNYNCFVYALGLQRHAEFLGNYGWEFTRNLGPVFDEMIKKKMLIPVSAASQGLLILYRADDGAISHVGLLEDAETVVSKWSWGPLIRHKIFDVPDHYGNNVEFYSISQEAIDFVIGKSNQGSV